MQRRRFLSIALAGLGLSACATQSGFDTVFGEPPRRPPAAAAPATPTAEATAVPRAVAGASERLLVRDGATPTPYLVSVDAATGKVAFSMAASLPTADGTAWLGFASAGDGTAITRFATKTGAPMTTFSVPGQYRNGAISHNDRWLLLTQPPAPDAATATSGLALVDLGTGTLELRDQLAGRYSADSVNDGGTSLFLIAAHPERKQNAYEVASYNPATKGIVTIADKRTSQELMAGYRVRQAWSRTGEWLFSLYLNPGGNGAFVHALNVANQFAACIDLPGRGQPEAHLQQYALATIPATDHVFAVNPALGVLAEFKAGEFDANVTPINVPGTDAAPAGIRADNNCVVTPDGRTLYAGSDRGILTIPLDSPPLRPSGMLLAGSPVCSLGMGTSGMILYALIDSAPRTLLALDPAQGTVLGDLSGLIGQPLSIEAVT